MSPDQAEREIIAGSGQKYHAGVVDAFAKAMGMQAKAAGA